MNRTTYRQLWSLYQKGNSLEATIEAIQAITLSREEATPWLVKFMKEYTDERVTKAVKEAIDPTISDGQFFEAGPDGLLKES